MVSMKLAALALVVALAVGLAVTFPAPVQKALFECFLKATVLKLRHWDNHTPATLGQSIESKAFELILKFSLEDVASAAHNELSRIALWVKEKTK